MCCQFKVPNVKKVGFRCEAHIRREDQKNGLGCLGSCEEHNVQYLGKTEA